LKKQFSGEIKKIIITLSLSFFQISSRYIVCLMVFIATFNNISAILWRSVLFVEETGGPKETNDLGLWV
jgi:energy-converting hydrogenase Eha subunit E